MHFHWLWTSWKGEKVWLYNRTTKKVFVRWSVTFDEDFILSLGGGASMETFSTPLGASSQPFNNESDDYYVHETTQVHQQ